MQRRATLLAAVILCVRVRLGVRCVQASLMCVPHVVVSTDKRKTTTTTTTATTAAACSERLRCMSAIRRTGGTAQAAHQCKSAAQRAPTVQACVCKPCVQCSIGIII